MEEQDKKPSEYLLARLHTGEAPEEEREQLHKALKESAPEHLEERDKLLAELADNERFLAMLAQGEEFLAAQVPVASETSEKNIEHETPYVITPPAPPISPPTPKRTWWSAWAMWWQWGGLSAGLAAMALFLTWHPTELLDPSFEPAPRDHLRVGTPKGAKQLGVWRIIYWRKGSRISQYLKQKQGLFPGDHIQFSYTLTHKRLYFAVVSVNASGKIDAYAPLTGSRSIQLARAKGTWPQASSLILDDALGHEQLIFAMATKPFSLKVLKASVKEAFAQVQQKLLKLPKPKGPWSIQRILIRKTKPKASAQRP